MAIDDPNVGFAGDSGYVSKSPAGSAESHMNLTADQQIRAKALECTVDLHMAERGWEPHNSSAFWKCLLEFEAYIREGK